MKSRFGFLALTSERFGLWKNIAGSLAIEYTRQTMESIRAEASHNMQGIGRGGVEVGGVLIGTRLGEFYRLLDWKPIPCSHSRGPSFLLSDAERAQFKPRLAEIQGEADQLNLQIIGWFVSHTRSDFALTDEEIDIHSRFFTRPWQLLLVVQPSRFGDAEAMVYQRISEREQVPVAQSPPIQIAPAPVELKPKERTRPTAPAPEDTEVSAVSRRVSGWLPFLVVALLTLAAAAGLVVGFLPSSFTAPDTPLTGKVLESVSLHAAVDESSLAITWDPQAVINRGVTRANLEILDSGLPVLKDLSKEELLLGRFDYPFQSTRIAVTLSMYDGVTFIGREQLRLRRR